MNKLVFLLNFILLILNRFKNINCDNYCSKFDEDEIQQTCPYTNEQIAYLVNSLPVYNHNSTCLIDEKCANNWMMRVNVILAKIAERDTFLNYNFLTNVTDENNKKILDFAPIITKANENIFENGKKFYEKSSNWTQDLRRMLYLTTKISVTDVNFTALVTNMTSIYGTTKIIRGNDVYELEPQLSDLLKNSRDYDEQLWAWKSWHDTVGTKVRGLFIQSVTLANEQAKKSGYNDLSEDWIDSFEMDNLEQIYDQLFEKIKPLYQHLHAYVRRKLKNFYGSDKLKTNYIPAHLLGNMWAQEWSNIEELVKPYPKEKNFNLTERLIAKKYTDLKLFEVAQKFYTSLGLYPMTDTFWKYSVIKKPKDRDIVCHPAAFDFSNGFDYRIKMCTEVNDDYFRTIHHEMGHIEYYMSYALQPHIYREGANTAFHEAIGDTITISVFTPTHLKKIGLQNFTIENNNHAQINFLMDVALRKIVALPFTYIVDKWRWDVFRGKIKPDEYNKKWWKMRQDYQGVDSIEIRNETYFDPGAKYHVSAYVPYARYYFSLFLQFQFYKSLCEHAGYTGPLHLCDFYGSKNAGLKFKEMLTLGRSKHWSYALKGLTGTDKIDPNGILDYFKPLMNWLVKENKNYPVGW